MMTYIKENIGTIALLVLFLLLGATLGVISKADEDGIYIAVNYQDGTEFFSIGKNISSIKNIDITGLDSAEVSVLASKLEDVKNNHELGVKLRDFAKRGIGPFKPIPVNLNIHFVDEQFVSGPVAKACRDTPILGNAMVAYDITAPSGSPLSIKGLMNIHATREQLASCDRASTDSYHLWLNRKHVEEWLGGASFTEDSLLVKANIVVASVSI